MYWGDNCTTNFPGGGSFSSPSDELLAEAKHVPKTNRFGESLFGVLDRLMRERPESGEYDHVQHE